MANFEYAFASEGTPTSFPIGDSGVTGVDEAGTLTPKTIKLDANVHVLLTATKTDAELRTAMEAFIKRYGGNTRGEAGGFPTQATLQAAVTETNVGAAD